MNVRSFRSGSVPIWISTPELHVFDTCQLHEDNYSVRYVDTVYRLHEHNFNELYVDATYHLNKRNEICREECFFEFSVYFVEGLGMSFASGNVCPQASQTCCDTAPLLGKDIPILSFLFCFLGGGGREGLEGR